MNTKGKFYYFKVNAGIAVKDLSLSGRSYTRGLTLFNSFYRFPCLQLISFDISVETNLMLLFSILLVRRSRFGLCLLEYYDSIRFCCSWSSWLNRTRLCAVTWRMYS